MFLGIGTVWVFGTTFLSHRVRTNSTARYKESEVQSPLIATMFENSLHVPLLLRASIPMAWARTELGTYDMHKDLPDEW